MDAGRELDRLVALNVMGWKWTPDQPDGVSCPYKPDTAWWITPSGEALCVHCTEEPHPKFSTEIAAAWEVVEHMMRHAPVRYRNLSMVAYCYNRTYATFDGEAFGDYEPEAWVEANGDNHTSQAICLAALRAVGAEVPA